MDDLRSLSKTIGYIFSDEALLLQALTHRSFSNKNNERLEFLGDSIINFVIADVLYRLYPDAKEGALSRLRAILVKGETLAELAKEFELGQYLRLGSGELKSGGFRRPSILADAVEAIIGGMYLDSDMETVKSIVSKWFAKRVENAIELHDTKDAKTRLQEYLQARKLPLPIYTLIKTEGEHHQQTFYIDCSVVGLELISSGDGDSRRRAEQVAAEEFLTLAKAKKK